MRAGFRPAFDGQKCSLGYELIQWLETFTCHGPGDIQGEPLDMSVDPEFEQLVIDCYELDPVTGRRLIKRAVDSEPKGRAKSERAGLIGVAEALGPVRFDGWDSDGQPVGRPVTSPFIRCLATEEKQSGNTFQNLAFVMGEWGQDVHPKMYGGIQGIRDYRSAQNVYLPGGGECRSSSSGSASKDGGKETFVVPDEVHLYVLPELRNMYATVMRNLPKRKSALLLRVVRHRVSWPACLIRSGAIRARCRRWPPGTDCQPGTIARPPGGRGSPPSGWTGVAPMG